MVVSRSGKKLIPSSCDEVWFNEFGLVFDPRCEVGIIGQFVTELWRSHPMRPMVWALRGLPPAGMVAQMQEAGHVLTWGTTSAGRFSIAQTNLNCNSWTVNQCEETGEFLKPKVTTEESPGPKSHWIFIFYLLFLLTTQPASFHSLAVCLWGRTLAIRGLLQPLEGGVTGMAGSSRAQVSWAPWEYLCFFSCEPAFLWFDKVNMSE